MILCPDGPSGLIQGPHEVHPSYLLPDGFLEEGAPLSLAYQGVYRLDQILGNDDMGAHHLFLLFHLSTPRMVWA